MNKLEQFPRKITGLFNGLRDPHAEQVNVLLAPGKIEKLVKTNRAPLKIGEIGAVDISKIDSIKPIEMQSYYQIPPKKCNPKKVKNIYFGAGGAYVFVLKNGKQLVGPTFTLTEKQAEQVEIRIEAEKKRQPIKKIKEKLRQRLSS